MKTKLFRVFALAVIGASFIGVSSVASAGGWRIDTIVRSTVPNVESTTFESQKIEQLTIMTGVPFEESSATSIVSKTSSVTNEENLSESEIATDIGIGTEIGIETGIGITDSF